MGEIIRVDAMGDACPIPVVKAKKALDRAADGAELEVHVDNEIAVQNLIKMAKSQGYLSEAGKEEEKHYVVRMRRDGEALAGSAQTASAQDQQLCNPDRRTGQIVVISSNVMGSGNDELGKVLMKGFLYALSQLDTLPQKILFYNGGVTWTTEGSDALEDLKLMAAQGVEILSCGTCLDYYHLKDKLMVGEVTNMYSIVEAMAEASGIIRP